MTAADPRRVSALARRHLRELARNRLLGWTLVAAVASWWLAADVTRTLRTALVLVLLASLFAVVVAGAGRIGDDLRSGAYLLDRLHGAAALDSVLGATAATFLAALPSFAILALALGHSGLARGHAGGVLLVLSWELVTIVAWSALATLLSVLVAGKGNAVLLVVFFLAAGFPASAFPLDAAPVALAALVRALWNALPLLSHVGSLRNAILDGAPPELAPPLALLLAAPACVFIAAWRLERLDPVARWTR